MKKRYLLPLTFGVLLSLHLEAQTLDGFTKDTDEKQRQIEKKFKETVDFSRFKTHLTTITSDPHPAGTLANEKVKDYMVESMKQAGWDVKVYPYDLYMTKGQGESLIELVYPIRKPLNQQEYIVKENPFSTHPDLQKGWNAYSGSGDVTAEVVYANYGTKADFEKLKELGIDLKGKIVLARYGGNFRGYKAK
ncbi:MAG: glutamate carboxypeptidase, partial [Cyclobacteriaceae bacterium]|nr:glutamate carboxypeptidase [Cyclobacteriaceae bacterium]